MNAGQLQRVLLVEDDESFSSVLARAVRARGYGVEIAESVDEAIAIARRWRPDAAVVDLKLGTESGLQLVPELMRMRADMRVLVLTGYASIATAVHTMKLGAADYLAKPADLEDILAALQGRRAASSEPVQAPSVRRLEWEHIQRVLAEHGGNISETARALRMHRRTLQRKLAKRPVQD